jgi:A/G-specific adenine glycosylase
MFDAKSAANLRQTLLGWYRANGRHNLPWRRTRDPYAVLVSELMLQQTQVTTVQPYFERWMRRFPDVETLASAREAEVLHAWQGLGYYSRARNLHAAAKEIAATGWPADLTTLPGVGRYTANAVATFAFDHPLPIVEANTARLLSRLTNLQERIDTSSGQQALWSCATALVPKRNAGTYNSALTDFGALVCTARNPQCQTCPLRRWCSAPEPESLPRKRERAAVKQLIEQHAYVRRNGSVLLQQSQERWRGLWILPQLNGGAPGKLLHESEFPFTHHRIALQVFSTPAPAVLLQDQQWVRVGKVAELPMPSPHRRAVESLLMKIV